MRRTNSGGKATSLVKRVTLCGEPKRRAAPGEVGELRVFSYDDFVVFGEEDAKSRGVDVERVKLAGFTDTYDQLGAVMEYRSDLVLYDGDREVRQQEYELLELFMRHPRQVLTREVIFDRVWGYDFGGESNIIEVYVRYLRQKTEAEDEPRLLHTVRGVGYVLRESA